MTSTMAHEYVANIEQFHNMRTDEVSRFCHWIAANGINDLFGFSSRVAEFRDGSRAERPAVTWRVAQ